MAKGKHCLESKEIEIHVSEQRKERRTTEMLNEKEQPGKQVEMKMSKREDDEVRESPSADMGAASTELTLKQKPRQ